MSSFQAKLQKLKPLLVALSPRRRRQLLGLQILSLAAAAGEVANIGALLPFLRLLANPKEGLQALGPLAASLHALPEQHLLLSLGLGFAIVVILSTTLRVLTIRAQLRLASFIAADLGEQVFSVVLCRPFSWHQKQNSSKVLGNLTKDVDQVSGSIQALLVIVVNLAIVLLLGGSLLALAPGVMLVLSALLAGFYLVVFRFTRGALRADGQRLTSNYQSSLQVAQEGLGGIRDVLLDRSQPFFISTYQSRNLSYRLAAAAINIKGQVPRYLIEGFVVVLIVGLSLSLALSGQGIEKQLPLLGTVSLGAYRLLQPLQQCFSSFSRLLANQASLQRLRPFLQATKVEMPPMLIQSTPLPKINAGESLIELRQLSFRYGSESPWVLRHLDLAIQRGERIAFVGSTGSGKSTTSDLILGLLKPTEGQLLVHGLDLHASPGLEQAWQQRVAHVPQSIYLSDSSFDANIAFGVPEAQIDQQRVRRAAVQARIAELIESSPEGYSTVVGERGVRLSGGQRQRIGLARALYKQAELLVLDEATSALDNRTEAEVMEAIEGLDQQITVLLIAHRLSTVQCCDRIFMLEQGRIAGIGSYQELLSSNTAFQKLARDRAPLTSP
ncbi:ABC transporter ATP-binding protein [Synechococcus sp. BMK-MC-1]|uniref:ABC transporter ATP-binding protein n=1 Tax=Synechococcus sp. BMK-MC-1 TaxID=1442551 RepID=UPI001649322D|nr:ABC transporter ATP-binding protein [Synechococcus sp. BMK-MC-1]QNI66408.1 ABC transporter type 1/ ATPase component [Synechococcus sp. BMK-MC-1]